ncbi:MAG: hemerythrin domain-containing protein [Fibrobacteres bacterium]|nr:hemerythrin domain-containing protein [Fibrobacterota bacterium]
MDGIKEWAYPSTRVGDAIKFRPACLELMYRLGCDPWAESDTTLGELGLRCGQGTQELVQELSSLPVPDRNSPWEELPAYSLIDYLTNEHRSILHSDLPALRSILDMPFEEASGGSLFWVLLDSFHRFTDSLRTHIQEEEDYLFPAILKNEHALNQGGPEHRIKSIAGDILASPSVIRGEERLDAALDDWTRAIGEHQGIGERPKLAELAARAMQDLEKKLRAHGNLEKKALYPIAARIEKELALAKES